MCGDNPLGLRGGLEMTPEELQEFGLNQSSQHADFVVGSSDITIMGVR
jgi:leucyl aminopeptidase (aminopeptidase T)